MFKSLTNLFKKNTKSENQETPVQPVFNTKDISDDWFRSHFVYAPDVINDWLKKHTKMPSPSLLDFGCGDGIMSLGMTLRHNIRGLCGVDLHDSNKFLAETAKTQIGLANLPVNLEFLTIDPSLSLFDSVNRKFDFAYSWSVFEHIEPKYLPKIVKDIKEVMNGGGSFFIQIEPLYFSPFGSHLGGVVKEPWAHLLLNEEDLTKKVYGFDLETMDGEFKNKTFDVCSNDDFKQYLMREFGTLNKLTCDQLIEFCENAGWTVVECWKNKVDMEPPSQLLRQYSRDDLVTSEIRLLLR